MDYPSYVETALQEAVVNAALGKVEAAHGTKARLEMRLIYGSYPEVVLMEANEDRELYIRELIGSYLFKDILQLEGVRHTDKLLRLLQLLAFLWERPEHRTPTLSGAAPNPISPSIRFTPRHADDTEV